MDVGMNTANGPLEEYLCDQASAKNIPILGTFELTPICNMNCNMCYVRKSAGDVSAQGGLKPPSFWIELAQKCKDSGMLFLMLTGGEPLTYPGFRELFVKLQSMGFIITMNTNGTMIDEEMALFFREHMIRRLNITLYGKDDETYGELCHNPYGFTQLKKAIGYLKKYQVPVRLNCSVTRQNYQQLPELFRIAEEWELPLEAAYYMFPPNRKDHRVEFEQYRNTPEEAARNAFYINTYGKSAEERAKLAHDKLLEMENSVPRVTACGYACRAANATFWVKWNGEMTPCGIMNEPAYNLSCLEFMDAWRTMVEDVQKIHMASKCNECKYQSICPHCAAGEVAECGHYGEAPRYQCDYCDAYLELLKGELKK